jgi:hypothetical protein
MHPLDHRIDRDELRSARWRENRTIITRPKKGASALWKVRAKPLDQFKLFERSFHRVGQAGTTADADGSPVRDTAPQTCKKNFDSRHQG